MALGTRNIEIKNMRQFIHLTDCHLQDHSADTYRNIKPYAYLNKIIANINLRHAQYDFILITGDISQTGTEKSYSLFETLLKKLGKPIYCLPGNHDRPDLLKKRFPQSPNQAISVNLIHNHLLILLNTKISDFPYGEVSTVQMKQLANLLSKNNSKRVIIALHHQPIKINSPWMDDIGLKNGGALMNLLGDFFEVDLLLFGHVHQAIQLKYKHIQVMSTPSTSYQYTPNSQDSILDNQAPGYRLVKLLNDNTIESQVYRVNQI